MKKGSSTTSKIKAIRIILTIIYLFCLMIGCGMFKICLKDPTITHIIFAIVVITAGFTADLLSYIIKEKYQQIY